MNPLTGSLRAILFYDVCEEIALDEVRLAIEGLQARSFWLEFMVVAILVIELTLLLTGKR